MPDFSNPYAPIDYGYSSNFFRKIQVSNPNYTTNCTTIINLKTPVYAVTFHLEATSTQVFYSMNGLIDHGDLTFGTSTATLEFTNRPISKLWLRGDGYIRIEAWSGH